MAQDILLLLTAGALFALLFVLVAVIRTIRRTERIGFLDTLLVFLTTLVLLAALLANRMADAPLSLVEPGARVIALVLLALCVLIAIAEWFRPQRLRQSRGMFGMGAALLVLISTLSVPFVAEYFALDATPTSAAPTVVAAVPTTSTPSGQERALSVFTGVVQVLAEETGLAGDAILARLDAGDTISKLIEDNGGDLEAVIDRITTLMSDRIRQAVGEERMGQAQAALALSQMEFIVRLGVNQRLDGERFERLFGGVESTEEPVAPTAITPTRTVASATPTRAPSATPTPVPTATITPAPTRTSPPVAPPTIAPTLATCVLIMNYNVNLRTAPDFGAGVRVTIPYNSVVTATGRTADSTWWYANYEGQSGWVSADYVNVDFSCADLPVIQ